MNLFYFAGSLIGIALIVALNLALFGRTRTTVGTLADVAARLEAEIAGFRAGDGIVATEGCAALLQNAADGSIYLVEAMGDRIVTRKLSRDALRQVDAEGSVLSLRLSDFTFSKSRLAFADSVVLHSWEVRLRQAMAAP